jgi:hypothetical protein
VLSQSADIPQALIAPVLLPERRPGVVIAGIGLLFAVAYLSSVVFFPKPDGRLLIGDALHHYVQLRSAVIDGDLHFRNEYVRMYNLRGGEPGAEWIFEGTSTGHVRNYMPVGPAILWAPLFLVAAGLTALANAFGAGWPMDGYARLFQVAPGVTGVAAAAVGVWLAYLAAARLATPRAAAWSALVLWLASSAVYYSLVSPAYSHAASLLVTSAFWLAWVRADAARLQRYVWLGGLTGAAALMRWQDAVLLAPIGIDLAWRWRQGTLPAAAVLRYGIVAAATGALVFAPQMAVWTILYGQPFALPQGEGFMRWSEPAFLLVLFSDWHGLLTWTPVCAVAIAGLWFLWRRDARTGAAAAVFLLISWYVNAAVADWWAGEAFGARRFISCFPVFVLGLAALIDKWSPSAPRLALAAAAVVGHTFLLFVQYQAFMHGLRDVAPYPRGFYNLWIARFVVPFDLAREWLLQ